MRLLGLSCLCLLITLSGYCQSLPTLPNTFPQTAGYFGPTKIIVKLDPVSRIPIGDVPFDRNFYIRMYFNAKSDAPNQIWLIKEFKNKVSSAAEPLLVSGAYGGDKDADDPLLKKYFGVDILMPPLDPNQTYALLLQSSLDELLSDAYFKIFKLINENKRSEAETFRNNDPVIRSNPSRPSFAEFASYYNQENLSGIFSGAGNEAAAKTAVLAKMKSEEYLKLADGTTLQMFNASSIVNGLGTRQGKIETSAPLSLIADVGLVVCGMQQGFSILTPYLGLNYSFRALDSDIPFHYLKKRISWYQRLALHAGLTLNTLAKDKYRGNIFGANNILTGLGYKFSHVVSIQGGVVFYNKLDPNPLIDRKTVAVAPYVGLSINLKIRAALGDLVKVFSYGK